MMEADGWTGETFGFSGSKDPSRGFGVSGVVSIESEGGTVTLWNGLEPSRNFQGNSLGGMLKNWGRMGSREFQ
jgi:hypothetical protein